jgi:RNA polymerase sigma factor (sigma-70 family)
MTASTAPELPTDQALAAAYAAGDEQAASELVRRHGTALGRFLYSAGAAVEEVEDLVQEALFRAFRGLPGWRRDASFRSWLFTIGGNLLKDEVRRRRKRLYLPLGDRDLANHADPQAEVVAGEAAHLASCSDCRAEWGLVRAAVRLGERAPRMTDASGIAATVLRRLAEAPPPRPARRSLRWALGIAAAAAITVTVWTGAARNGNAPGPAGAGDPVPSAEPLGVAQVDSLLDEEEGPLAGWSMLDTPTLGDLSEVELERVLRTWEG